MYTTMQKTLKTCKMQEATCEILYSPDSIYIKSGAEGGNS